MMDRRDDLRAYFRLRDVASFFWLTNICGPGNDTISFSLESTHDGDLLALTFRSDGQVSPMLHLSEEDARELIDVLEAFVAEGRTDR